jgi:NAD(P)-dependent dehydrogenase (short-subunit alcohol dehydrogenase family)
MCESIKLKPYTNKKELDNMKTVFVTGTDRGLGLGFVKVLLESGHNVFAGHFSSDTKELSELKYKYNNKLSLVRLDISSDESVRQASEEIKKQTNSIDILINNAGILGDIEKTIMDKLDFEEILKIINVNTLGPIRVINELVDLVLKSETKIIANISSEAGSIGQNYREGWFGYCMSKSALNMGGALIHKNIIKQGGRVMQIHPGWVKSYMSGSKNEAADYEPEDAATRILKTIDEYSKSPSTNLPIYVDLNGKVQKW